jgi:NADH pyrophosphatase NudC (nudix superfamily)
MTELEVSEGFKPVRIKPGTYKGEIVDVRDSKPDGTPLKSTFGPILVIDVKLNDAGTVLGITCSKKLNEKSKLGQIYASIVGSLPKPGTRVDVAKVLKGKKVLAVVVDKPVKRLFQGKEEEIVVSRIEHLMPLPEDKATEATKCGNCGAEVSSNAKFCPNCGAPIIQL